MSIKRPRFAAALQLSTENTFNIMHQVAERALPNDDRCTILSGRIGSGLHLLIVQAS
jgi:hypothetical protein